MARTEEFTKFRISKPYGYNPPDVEAAILQYEETVGRLNAALVEVKQANIRFQERIRKLEDELRAMHLEMSCMELPDTEEAIQSVVLNDFKNYHNDVQPEAPPKGKELEGEGIVDIEKELKPRGLRFGKRHEGPTIEGLGEEEDEVKTDINPDGPTIPQMPRPGQKSSGGFKIVT